MNLFKDHHYPMATEFSKWESTLQSTHSRYPLYLVTAEEGGCLLVAPRAAANESVSTLKRASALTPPKPPAQTALCLSPSLSEFNLSHRVPSFVNVQCF